MISWTAAKNRPNIVAAAWDANGSNVVTPLKPTGTAIGDLMVAFLSSVDTSGTNSWTQASGWTEVLDQGSAPNLGIQYRVATSDDALVTQYDFTHTATGIQTQCDLITFRNAAYDTVGTIGTATLYQNCTAPSITVTSCNSLLLAYFATDPYANKGWALFPVPPGLTFFTRTANAAYIPVLIAYKSVESGATGDFSSDYTIEDVSLGAVAGVLLSLSSA